MQDSPDGCKHSPSVFSRQHLLGLPCQREVRCSVFNLDALLLCNPPDHRAKIWPQISYHLWCARSIASNCLSFPFLAVHRCRPSSPTLNVCADHTGRVDSFVSKFWDGSTVQNNLQFPIYRFPTKLRSIFYAQSVPASSTLGRRLHHASKPNLSGASSRDASTLSSTCSRRAGRSFVDSSRCFDDSSVPASFLQQTLQTNGPL